MPRSKTPCELRFLCLCEAVKLLSIISSRNKINVEDASYSKSSFVYLIPHCPGTILEDLIDLLQVRQPSGIDCIQLELLLKGNVQRLWLHYQNSKSLRNVPLGFQRVLRKIGLCGSFITDLSLKGCILWNNEELVLAVKSLTNVRRLVLHSSKLDDEVLIAVGESCRFVEEVSFSSWNITDCGLKALLGNESLPPPPLKSIILESDRNYVPKVTKAGVIYAINRLPQLRQLKVPHLTDALVDLSENSCNKNTLQIRIYHDDNMIHSLDHLDSILKLCPFLENIRIMVNKKDPLLLLQNLKFLKLLSVSDISLNSGDLFLEGITPLLKISGFKLTRLELSVTEIDLSVIANYCPSLSDLECLKVSRFKTKLPLCQKPFASLVNLKLFVEGSGGVRGSDLLVLLSNCKSLQFLFVGWCEALTDNIICEILSRNSFPYIEEIEICDISSITVIGLQHLILTENNLKKLNVQSCDFVMREDIHLLRALLKERNLDLEIMYYE